MTTIRHIETGDFANWHQLWTGYLDYYETTLPVATKKLAFGRLLDRKTNVHGYLAEHGGQPVGLVHYIFHDHMWRPEGICYLQDLYTEPDVRGAGIGRALIEKVYEASDAAGVPGVYWLTQDFNETARRLYDQVSTLTPFIKYQR